LPLARAAVNPLTEPVKRILSVPIFAAIYLPLLRAAIAHAINAAFVAGSFALRFLIPIHSGNSSLSRLGTLLPFVAFTAIMVCRKSPVFKSFRYSPNGWTLKYAIHSESCRVLSGK